LRGEQPVQAAANDKKTDKAMRIEILRFSIISSSFQCIVIPVFTGRLIAANPCCEALRPYSMPPRTWMQVQITPALDALVYIQYTFFVTCRPVLMLLNSRNA
jgi:hypothetical protein